MYKALHFLLAIGCLLAGKPSLGAQHSWRFLSLSEKEGLPVKELFDLSSTENGMLWMASLYGLVKFDGETFEVLNHNPLDSTSITFGRLLLVKKSRFNGGMLWLGSATGGLCQFEIRTEKARTFLHDSDKSGCIGGNYIAGILENDSGGVWVGTDNFTLNYLPPGSRNFQKWQPPLPKGVHSTIEAGLLGEIVQDTRDKNRIWIGSRFGIYNFDIRTKTFKLHPFTNPFTYFYIPSSVPLWQDETGLIWTTCHRFGLLRYDPVVHHWATWKTDANQINRNGINQIFPLDDSLLLCTTPNAGLWLFNRKSTTLKVLNQQNTPGLPDAELRSAFKNEEGDIWLATMAGLIRITRQPQPIKLFLFPDKFPSLQKNNWQRAYALSPDRTKLYMGTLRGDGLLIFDWKNKQMEIVRYQSTTKATGWDIWLDDLCFDPDSNLWIGSEAGLLRFDRASRHIYPVFPLGKDSLAFQGHHVASIATDAHGKLWIGTLTAGLFCFDRINGQLIPFQTPEGQSMTFLKHERIKKVFLDRNELLWIGTENQLYRYNLTLQSLLPPLKSSVIPKNINDIDQDSAGTIWISTYGAGLFRYKPKAESLDFINNPSPPGANWMYELIVDHNGTIWIGTDAGLSNYRPKAGEFTNFGTKDGVDLVLKGALIQLPDGTIINGSSQGFHLFQPNAWNQSNHPPKPYLKILSVFGEKIVAHTGDFVALEQHQNSFSIEFSAINFNLYPQTNFAYRLEGQENDWVESGDRRFVTYTNLSPGKYTFYLKSIDKQGDWSAPVRLLDINIPPAFYQTFWFKSLVFISFFLLLWSIYLLRVKQIRRQEQWKISLDHQLADLEMQALRAQMNPHFLHNSLNAINWFILEEKPEQASKYLVKFSRLMRLVLSNSRLKKISLAQELEALHLYVSLEQIRLENSFLFSLEISDDIDSEEIKIPPLLLQPYIENAIWHGLMNKKDAPGQLRIRLWLEKDCLICTIEDNGIGRQAAAKIKEATLAPAPSQAMEITAKRLDLLERTGSAKAQIQIFDLENDQAEATGTKVQLQITVG